MFEKYANKIEYNEVEENRTKNVPNLPKNHDLQETEQDLPGTPQSPLHIPSSLAHSRRNAVRHVNCLYNARSITKRLGTRQTICGKKTLGDIGEFPKAAETMLKSSALQPNCNLACKIEARLLYEKLKTRLYFKGCNII